MSKIDMPRPRYVAFRMEPASAPSPPAGTGQAPAPPVGRKAVGLALRALARQRGWRDDEGPHLTRFAWPHAIARVEHTRVADLRALLPQLVELRDGNTRLAVRTTTLSTSGTLDALTTRIGILAERTD